MDTNKVDHEKIASAIKELKEAAEAAPENLSPEDVFAAKFTKSASDVSVNKELVATVAQELLNYIKENDNVRIFDKNAGVNVPLVGSEAGVSAPDAGDPTLGKTVTTTNEVEKGLVGTAQTNLVDSIVQRLMAVKGHTGGPAIIVEGAPQPMPVKAAELEKVAEGKQTLENLFTKYASQAEDPNEAATAIYKYASQAEDILIDEAGEDNYSGKDIFKIASTLIDLDLEEYQGQLNKQAELEYTANLTAEIMLQKFAEYNNQEVELTKQAEAVVADFVKQAEDALVETGKQYTEEDILAVAEAMIDKAIESQNQQTPVEQVIGNL